FISLPVLFVSSALAPLNQMPGWLRDAAQLNPMTYAIEATRKLVVTGWDFGAIGRMVLAILLFDAVALVIAAWVLRRGLE
ncbi:MAG TPA: ABC transporter permease, partial [Thermomicrobiaceae bacterium]|nr:ABC transporter permease [Thermomicrobiaceae bacterium]